MNEDAFNVSIRKFLKPLGVTAQREIEKAVREALADGRLKGNEKLPAKATVTIPSIGLGREGKGHIELAVSGRAAPARALRSVVRIAIRLAGLAELAPARARGRLAGGQRAFLGGGFVG